MIKLTELHRVKINRKKNKNYKIDKLPLMIFKTKNVK